MDVWLSNGGYIKPEQEVHIGDDSETYKLYPKFRSVLTGKEGRLRKKELEEVLPEGSPKAVQRKGRYNNYGPQNLDGKNYIYPGDEFIILGDPKTEGWTQIRLLSNGKEGLVPSTTIEELPPSPPPSQAPVVDYSQDRYDYPPTGSQAPIVNYSQDRYNYPPAGSQRSGMRKKGKYMHITPMTLVGSIGGRVFPGDELYILDDTGHISSSGRSNSYATDRRDKFLLNLLRN